MAYSYNKNYMSVTLCDNKGEELTGMGVTNDNTAFKL